MAIPTDFKGYTPAAGTTKSFRVVGTSTVGIWANDVDGTLSATTSMVPIAPNMVLLMAATYTDAQIAAYLKDYLARMGTFHEGAGGQAVEVSKQIVVTATTCT